MTNRLGHVPALRAGIAPDTGEPTNHDAPYTSAQLLGTDRFFNYSRPAITSRARRSARSPYATASAASLLALVGLAQLRLRPLGYDVDANFHPGGDQPQRIVFGSVPEVYLPGPQDIDGLDAV
jgi:hypothetical protein